MSEPTTIDAGNRLLSLDVFRGLTIAGMVLVNNPGSWEHIYWPLEHAEWNGWTPTDLVFPFFLFMVGVAIPLALGRRVERGDRFRDLFLKIGYRTVVIFALGEFLAGFPYFQLGTIRIPGVLQRIAVCYCIASLIYLKTRPRQLAAIALALLIVYCLLMKYVPVPGYGSGDLSKVGSLASYIDRSIFGPHIWRQGVVYDPEGLLSTMGALATTLFGVLTGYRLRCQTRTAIEKVAGMFIAGACCIVVGWVWNAWFPINKSLWTSSYVFFTGGLALQLLALLYWLIDIKGYRAWARPFVVFGVNAIVLFVGTGVMGRLLGLIKVQTGDGTGTTLQGFIYHQLFLSWAQPVNASLAYAIVFIMLWLGLMWILYWRRIIIKI
jgi:predicted acyltransferase